MFKPYVGSISDISKYSKYGQLRPPPPSDASLTTVNSNSYKDMSIPGAVGDAPASYISELESLEEIDKNDENQGYAPASDISDLEHLEEIDKIYENQGDAPADISELESLEEIEQIDKKQDAPPSDISELESFEEIEIYKKHEISQKLSNYENIDQNPVFCDFQPDDDFKTNEKITEDKSDETIINSDDENVINVSTNSTQTLQYNGPDICESEYVNSDTQTNSNENISGLIKSKIIKNSLSKAFTNVFSNEAKKIGCLADQVIENIKETTFNKNHLIEIIKKNDDIEDYIRKLLELLNERNNLCTNLEKQNSALVYQNKCMEDIITITKNIINIRNAEVENIHEDLKSMAITMKDERLKRNTSEEKLQEALRINDHIKKEYLTQMDLFKNLKAKFTQKILDLTYTNDQFVEYVQMKDLEKEKPMFQTILSHD